jgi:hypothetical protein
MTTGGVLTSWISELKFMSGLRRRLGPIVTEVGIPEEARPGQERFEDFVAVCVHPEQGASDTAAFEETVADALLIASVLWC